jgi:hypothetical protein
MDALSRKRPSSSSEAGPSQVKKRALASSNGLPSRSSPVSHDESDTREPQDESLEVLTHFLTIRLMTSELKYDNYHRC